MKQLRMSSRLSAIENWQKVALEQEAARARVIMDMSFATNALARRLAYHDKILVFDPDMLEFAQMNPDTPLTVRDLVDLLIPVPVVNMDDLNKERETCLREFHEEETRRRAEEEKQRKEIEAALKDKKLTDACSQCGKPFGEEACGPTHATIQAHMKQRAIQEAKAQAANGKPNGEPTENVEPTTEVPDIEVSDERLPFCTSCGEDYSHLVESPPDCLSCGLPMGLDDDTAAVDDPGPADMPPPESAVPGPAESARA
jgi:hypothetical protein